MKKRFFMVGFLLIVVLLIGVGCGSESDQSEKVKVITSVLPQTEFVERVGGDKVEVEAMIGPGYSPATYEPTGEQLKEVSEADVYFRIGKIPFEEAYMDKIKSQNEAMIVVDTSEGTDFRELESHSHEEGGLDPHVWMSPVLVEQQIEKIYEGLVEVDSDNKDYYRENADNYIEELEKLDVDLENSLGQAENKKMFVYHPAFGYLADEYGFEQISIEIEGKEPTAEQLANLIDEAKEVGVKVIFVQKQFSKENAEQVAAEIDGAVVQIDPLDLNYLENMKYIGDTIGGALGQK